MAKKARKRFKIACAFHWHECIDPSVEAKHDCELRKMRCPYWVKVHLSAACPFLGNELRDIEIKNYDKSGWKWKET